MSDQQWLQAYFAQYQRSIVSAAVNDQLIELSHLFRAARDSGRKAIVAGNGGSAALASHCAVDLTKVGGVRSITFNEADLITCFANDFGYDRWLEKALEYYADTGDLVILVSSSGRSPNMLRAAEHARARDLPLVTFTGFDSDNPLRTLGRINLWVDSHAYNIVEMTHQIWLLGVCDLLIGTAEYPPS
jgi:D-sedoheptulose 7-phosphate isomerase